MYQLRFPDATSLGDITKIDGEGAAYYSRRKEFDYIFSGSFPCQDISCAGKREGIKGKRSGLWSEYLRLIQKVRPIVVMVENVGDLAIRGLDRVIADLASVGYSACWRIIHASDMGAPHLRERLWIIATSNLVDFTNDYPGVDPISFMSFRLKRRVFSSGGSVSSIEDVSYFDKYYVGHARADGIYNNSVSVGRSMPKGGFLSSNGEVWAVPAWERGLEVYEVLENSDNDSGGIFIKGSSGEVDQRRTEGFGSRCTVDSSGAGVGYEDVARRSSFRHQKYSELQGAWDVKPGVFRVVDGVHWYVGIDREVPFPVSPEKVENHNKMLSCYGNAILPQIAWLMFRRIKPLFPDCYLG